LALARGRQIGRGAGRRSARYDDRRKPKTVYISSANRARSGTG